MAENERNAPYLIETIGRAAYGEYAWPIMLAEDLPVNSNSLRQWRIERREPPPGAWGDMLRLLRRRRAEIDQAERELLEELPRLAPDLAKQIDDGTFAETAGERCDDCSSPLTCQDDPNGCVKRTLGLVEAKT